MCAWIVPPAADLIETAIAPEFHVDGIGAIEIANGCIRLYLFAEQMLLDSPERAPAKVVMTKLTAPLCNVPEAIVQLTRCLLPHASAESLDNGPWPRAVK